MNSIQTGTRWLLSSVNVAGKRQTSRRLAAGNPNWPRHTHTHTHDDWLHRSVSIQSDIRPGAAEIDASHHRSAGHTFHPLTTSVESATASHRYDPLTSPVLPQQQRTCGDSGGCGRVDNLPIAFASVYADNRPARWPARPSNEARTSTSSPGWNGMAGRYTRRVWTNADRDGKSSAHGGGVNEFVINLSTFSAPPGHSSTQKADWRPLQLPCDKSTAIELQMNIRYNFLHSGLL